MVAPRYCSGTLCVQTCKPSHVGAAVQRDISDVRAQMLKVRCCAAVNTPTRKRRGRPCVSFVGELLRLRSLLCFVLSSLPPSLARAVMQIQDLFLVFNDRLAALEKRKSSQLQEIAQEAASAEPKAGERKASKAPKAKRQKQHS